jgi:hypothetical protein
MNMKFIALRLWLDSAEVENAENSDIDALIKAEFSTSWNSLLQEAHALIGAESNSTNSNQISNFKNSQVVCQFLTDLFLNCIENCKDLLSFNDSANVNLSLYQIALTTASLLSNAL